MIKNIILVFLFFSVLLSCNESSNNIDYRYSLLAENNNYKSLHEDYSFGLDSTGFSEFPKFKFECVENDSSSFWHVEDLNSDGKKDLIYSGPCLPYNLTAVFINKDGKMELIDKFSGKLISIRKDKNDTKIYVLAKSIGCLYFSSLKEVSIANSFQLTEKRAEYHIDTEVSISKNMKEVINFTGIIRHTPIIDDSLSKDPCTDDFFNGNQIANLNDELVTILDSKKGWSLVSYSKDETTELIGWIKVN